MTRFPTRSARRLARRLPLLAAALAALAAPPAGALPLISEVFYDAVGSDDGLSFVELYGPPGTVLDGLALELVNGADGAVATTLALAGVIGPSSLFVVADRFADGTTAVAPFDLLLNFDLQNGPDSLVLRGPAGVLDAVGFGAFDGGEVFAGEGAPAPDVAAGASLARLYANVDTGDNALDFAELAIPTPGAATLHPVPEPGTAGLSAGGALGLAWLGRARRRRAGPPPAQRRSAPH